MTTDIERWGDSQQFHAAPHEGVDPDVGVLPEVHLQWMTPDPLGALAMGVGMYSGKVFRHISEVTDDDRREAWEAMLKTHLTGGLEIIRFQFLFDGVDRAFTHQDVRARQAAFFQESLRFAVLDDLTEATSLPPSLAGTKLTEDYNRMGTFREMRDSNEFARAGDRERQRMIWDYVIRGISEGYNALANEYAMPAEEARGLLPTAVATRIVHNADLRNLVHHAGNRLCTQAQFHWRIVYNGIVASIRNYTPDFSWMGGPESGFGTSQRTYLVQEWEQKFRWQYETIANSSLFRPACYQLGRCPFQASFDRACTIRERVEIRAKHGGKDPSQWHKPFIYEEPYDDGCHVQTRAVTSPGINPAEWLLDPGAARVTGAEG